MTNPRKMMMAAAGAGGYQPIGADFDGTNDYLSRGAQFSNTVDSKIFSISFWFKTATPGGQLKILQSATVASVRPSFDFEHQPDDDFDIKITDTSGTIRMQGIVATPGDTDWHHFCFSVDMTNSSNRASFIDDSAATTNWLTYQDYILDNTMSNFWIGSTEYGTQKYNGAFADFWMQLGGTRADFETTATRRKFITAEGSPVDLGSDGQTPGFGAPTLFLTGAIDTWHTNAGDGGGMTETGALTEVTGPT